MKTCYNCENEFEMQSVQDSIIIEDKFLGKITTKETEVLMCSNCNEFVITKEIARLIEDKTDKQRNLLIKALPFSKFISTKKASEMLSISRQAIHKNSHFKRIVYNSKIDNQLFFVKRSVEKYKKTGDGRFNLSQDNNYEDFKIYLHRNREYDKIFRVFADHLSNELIPETSSYLLQDYYENQKKLTELSKKEYRKIFPHA